MLYRFGCVLGAVLFAVVFCNCTATTSSSTLNQNQSKSKTDDTRSLDLDKPEIEQGVKLVEADVANAKFVEVDVVEVNNPRNLPARFEVYFQPLEGEKIMLGSFSLYPPNNPGQFIVPTQGKVKGKGKLILSLAKPDQVAAGDVVQIKVKPMKLVADIDH